MRIALVYDMDSCRGPTGVTRHALAQVDGLRRRGEIDLRLVTGRLTEPDGLAFWESLDDLNRSELPVRTRNALRWWRLKPWPPLEWWTGAVDWVYSPAEYAVPTRQARRALTSHDALQVVREVIADCKAAGVPSVIENLIYTIPGEEPATEAQKAERRALIANNKAWDAGLLTELREADRGQRASRVAAA